MTDPAQRVESMKIVFSNETDARGGGIGMGGGIEGGTIIASVRRLREVFKL